MLFDQIGNDEMNWTAKWLWQEADGPENTWLRFRKMVNLSSQPREALVHIAADSKYWLWINGVLAVREGELKRGPSPRDTYYDTLDITPFLKSGDNTFAILVWHWGLDGASHNSSGKGGLLFEAVIDDVRVVSDDSWRIKPSSAFLPSEIRRMSEGQRVLCEWDVHYDARLQSDNWMMPDYSDAHWQTAIEKGEPPCEPWNRLIARPIPFWKDSELLEYENQNELLSGKTSECVIIGRLPANLQVYPYFKISAPEGLKIFVQIERDWKTTEYITKQGIQEFEVPAWGNGHFVEYRFPQGVEILDLKYRETGYDTEFSGNFSSDDPKLDLLWQKSARSVYINMRDGYADPERERSQWPGDAANVLEPTFYAFDRKSDLLSRKFFMELLNWRTDDGIIWGAVPTGRFKGLYREFPAQTFAAIGIGLREYFMHTGDIDTLREAYPHVKQYLLGLWHVDDKELVAHRGPWEWGWTAGTQCWYDWSTNQDLRLMDNCWYYISLKALKEYAGVLDHASDLDEIDECLRKIENGFDALFWNGKYYMSPGFDGEPDDRGNALAVYGGIADAGKFEQLREVFKNSLYSSIYMERYAIEALLLMGYSEDALCRMKSKFEFELNSSYTTLPESFGEDSNHGWGAWPIAITGKYVSGIYPLKPSYEVFSVKPQLGGLKHLHTSVPTVRGTIELEIHCDRNEFSLRLVVPDHTEAWFDLSCSELSDKMVNLERIRLNGNALNPIGKQLHLPPGTWLLEAF